jgi:hypothetical protein
MDDVEVLDVRGVQVRRAVRRGGDRCGNGDPKTGR